MSVVSCYKILDIQLYCISCYVMENKKSTFSKWKLKTNKKYDLPFQFSVDQIFVTHNWKKLWKFFLTFKILFLRRRWELTFYIHAEINLCIHWTLYHTIFNFMSLQWKLLSKFFFLNIEFCWWNLNSGNVFKFSNRCSSSTFAPSGLIFGI